MTWVRNIRCLGNYNHQGYLIVSVDAFADAQALTLGTWSSRLGRISGVEISPVAILNRTNLSVRPIPTRPARMHELLNKGWSYTPETLDECARRYSRFGSELYQQMADTLPECFAALRCFRADDYQTEDSFAVCEMAHPFAIQLDPDCEVICLWDSQTHVEIGTWSSNPYAEAFDFIRRHFLNHAA